MGIPYPVYDCKRIVFYAVFLVLFAAFSLPAQAYDDLFVVEKVKVDVTAENSVTARDQAFVQAQIEAFKILSERMLTSGQQQSSIAPDPAMISTLIQDFEITDEQLSSVRYIGTYTIRFKEDAISRYFSGTGVAYTDTSSKPLLVLPFFREGTRVVIWSEGNSWMKAWSRSSLPRSLVPIEVPIGDLMDVADLGEAQGLNYNAQRLKAMLGRYGAKEAALMLAVPDGQLASVKSENDNARGQLSISVYRTDRGRPELMQDFSIKAKPGETRAQFYDRAVKRAHGALQEDWKRKTAASSTEQSRVHARVPFSGLKEWVQIQQLLRSTSGISAVSILSLTPREAYIEFHFRGDERRLRQVLSQAHINLSAPKPKSGGERFKNPGAGAKGPSHYYDLLWGKRRTDSFFQNNVMPAAGGDFGTQTF